MKDIRIRNLKPEQFPIAQKFYEFVGYTPVIEKEAYVLAAFSKEEIIGLVRIAGEFGHLVLRGMYIHPDYQRSGVGTRMLRELEKSLGEKICYCIPHDWLEGFYGQIGVTKIDPALAPAHLQERLQTYLAKYPQLIMMRRKTS